MGTPDFAVSSLDAIVQQGYDIAAVVTVPDKPSGRGQKLSYSPVKEYALQHNLPILQPEKLRDDLFVSQLRALQADIFVVVAFRMLPEVVWRIPPMGTFNLHASLLPQYRGAAPINWAIINGDKQTGVTTFLINERIDEGRILMQESTPINDDDNAETIHDRLAAMGSRLVTSTLDGLFSGSLQPQPQPSSEVLRPAPKIFKADCAIDWHKGCVEIHNFVRGLSPYPSASATFADEHGEKQYMKIYQTSYEIDGKNHAGEMITDQKKQMKIGVNNGFISILSLQISGKKKNQIEDFLRGHNISNWKLII